MDEARGLRVADALGFTTSLQGGLELAGSPIRVHAVCPDAVATDMVDERRHDREAAIIFSAPRLALFPRFGLKLLKGFRWAGERKRRRAAVEGLPAAGG